MNIKKGGSTVGVDPSSDNSPKLFVTCLQALVELENCERIKYTKLFSKSAFGPGWTRIVTLSWRWFSTQEILNTQFLPTLSQRGLFICTQTVYTHASRPWCESFTCSQFAYTFQQNTHNQISGGLFGVGAYLLSDQELFWRVIVGMCRQTGDSRNVTALTVTTPLILGNCRGTEPRGKQRGKLKIYKLACG